MPFDDPLYQKNGAQIELPPPDARGMRRFSVRPERFLLIEYQVSSAKVMM